MAGLSVKNDQDTADRLPGFFGRFTSRENAPPNMQQPPRSRTSKHAIWRSDRVLSSSISIEIRGRCLREHASHAACLPRYRHVRPPQQPCGMSATVSAPSPPLRRPPQSASLLSAMPPIHARMHRACICACNAHVHTHVCMLHHVAPHRVDRRMPPGPLAPWPPGPWPLASALRRVRAKTVSQPLPPSTPLPLVAGGGALAPGPWPLTPLPGRCPRAGP